MTYSAYLTNAGQSARLAESWAQAVGWFITKQIYGPTNLDDTYFDFDSYQNLQITDFGYYTPIFIDLTDNFNQNLFPNNNLAPVDIANGYTLQQLQGFLIAIPTNWYMYRDYLENNSSNPTETSAVQMFSDYD